MKKRALSILLLLLFADNYIICQDGFPKIENNEIPGIKILQEKYYDGNSLWGYIDGGADIYLEYGFKKLLSYDVELNNTKYKTDIYKMNGAESAYGIFSASSFKCLNYDSLLPFSCITKYQYQYAAGDFYVSIINDKGDERAKQNAALIAKLIASKIEAVSFRLPQLYDAGFLARHINEVKCYVGMLGIQNSIPEWEQMFANITSFTIYNLAYELQSGNINIGFIKFNNSEELTRFANKVKLEITANNKITFGKYSGGIISAWKISNNALALVETKEANDGYNELVNQLDSFIKNKY